MTVKSDINILRGFCLIIIILSVYNYNVNNGFFGFLIILFSLLFLFSGRDSMNINDDQVSFKFKRLVPIGTKIKTIKLKEIESSEFIEGKITATSIILNLIAYAPGTMRSDDEIIIKLINGNIFRHNKVGTKKQSKDAITIINKKIKTIR